MKGLSAAAAATLVACLFAPAAHAVETLPPSGVLDLAKDADAVLTGAAAGDRTGWAVARAGDVNGDGVPDMAIGAPLADPAGRADAGAVYVVFGARPLAPKTALGTLGGGGFVIQGGTPGDVAGTALAGAGDVNGDGKADLLVGAPHASDRGPDGNGAAYVVFGKSDAAPADLRTLGTGGIEIRGANGGDDTGAAVAGLGDVNGDGRPDVAIGAPRAGNANAGAAYVVFGTAGPGAIDLVSLGDGGWRADGPAGSFTGLAVGAVPDLDGDGRAEMVTGAPAPRSTTAVGAPGATPPSPSIAGGAFVVFSGGRAGGQTVDLATLADRGLTIEAAAADGLGLAVTGTPDLTGDGVPDLALGAPFADGEKRKDAGALFIVPGRKAPGTVAASSGFKVAGALPGEHLGGGTVDALGDLDGDGRQDVVVTAPFATVLGRAEAGGAFVLFGAAKPADVDESAYGNRGVQISGVAQGGRVRSAVSVGDVTGDGSPDLVLGDFLAKEGAAYVVAGPKPPPPPPPPLPADPGEQLEVSLDKCHAAKDVAFLIDDSGSMEDSDVGELRAQAISMLMNKPRNVGKRISAVEFGDTTDQLFAPVVLRALDNDFGQRADVTAALDAAIGADNGSTDYNAGFGSLKAIDPDAEARIFLTDGAHNVGSYEDPHRGGPPTYVVGLGIGKGGTDGLRLARIAAETKGLYFPSVTAQKLQAVMNAIDSKLNCDIGLDAFVDELTKGDDVAEANDVDLGDGTESVDVDCSWDDPGDKVLPEDVELYDGDDRVARFSRRALLKAIHAKGKATTIAGRKVTASRGRTFFTLRINGVKGADRLRVRVRAPKLRGGARVHTQVTASRRHR